MALNNLGMGLVIEGEDATGPAFDSAKKRVGKFKQFAQNATQGLGAALTAVGGVMTAGAYGAIRVLGGMLDQARAFGAGVAEVSTLIDESVLSTAQIRATTMGMAKEFGTTGVEQSKALYQTISAGITDAAKATELLDTANRLAVGGVTDTETAVDGLTTVINAYAKANLDASDISDAFFVAIKAGKTTARELASEMGDVTSNAASAGIEFDQLLAAIAAITTGGIKTSAATSGLAAALGNLNKPSKDAADEAKRLGVEFSAAAVRSKGFPKFLSDIVHSANFTEDSMTKLFGSIEASKVMLALSYNEGAKFTEIMGQMGDRTGETQAAFDKMAATYDFQAKRLDALRGALETTLGTGLEALLTPALRLLNSVLETLNQIADAIPPEARAGLLGVAGALTSIGLATGGVIAVAGALSMLGVTLSSLAVAGLAFTGIFGVVAVALSGLGIAAYGAYRAVSDNVGGLGDTFADFRAKASLAFRSVVELIRGGQLSEATFTELNKVENRGVLQFVNRVVAFGERFKAFWEGIKDGFRSGLAEIQPAIDRFNRALGGIFGTLAGENATDTLEGWTANGRTAGRSLARLAEIALDAATNFIDFGKQAAIALEGITAEDVRAGIETLVTSFRVLGGVLDGVYHTAQILYRFLTTIGAAAAETFRAPIALFKGEEIYANTRSQFLGLGEAVAGLVEPVGGGAKPQAASAGATIGAGLRFGAGLQQPAPAENAFQNVRPDEVANIQRTLVTRVREATQEGKVLAARESAGQWGAEESMRQKKLDQTIVQLNETVRKLAEVGIKATVDVETIGRAVERYKQAETGREL